jgi:hypothetical protein
MRPSTTARLLLSAAACVVAPGQVTAQTGNAPGSAAVLVQNADRAAKIKEISERGSKYFAECMQLWDPETHMTKKEWEQTCRRVTDERTKFLRDQLNKSQSN